MVGSLSPKSSTHTVLCCRLCYRSHRMGGSLPSVQRYAYAACRDGNKGTLEGESSEQAQRLAVADLPGALPLEMLAWSPVERIACLLHLAAAGIVEAPALREPVPEKAICVLVGAPLPWMVGMAEAGRRSLCFLEALCIRELLAPVESDGMGNLPLERPLRGLAGLGMGLPGGLAVDKVSAHPVDLGDEACTALPASDRIAFPVACPAPGRCLFRPLGDVMGYAHLAPALLASLPVPALSMVPEQPCRPPVPRKLAAWGSVLRCPEPISRSRCGMSSRPTAAGSVRP